MQTSRPGAEFSIASRATEGNLVESTVSGWFAIILKWPSRHHYLWPQARIRDDENLTSSGILSANIVRKYQMARISQAYIIIADP